MSETFQRGHVLLGNLMHLAEWVGLSERQTGRVHLIYDNLHSPLHRVWVGLPSRSYGKNRSGWMNQREEKEDGCKARSSAERGLFNTFSIV